MIIELLNLFDPAPDVLLREISRHVSNAMLESISVADYGQCADEQFAALKQVRDTGTFPKKIHWVPMEVLGLVRWSELENSEWKPGETGEFGHWIRAFSCAAILRATREPWNYGDGVGTDSTLIHLVLSLHALPIDFTAHVVRSLTWLLLHSDPEGSDGQVCAYGLSLLWFALKHPTPFPDEQLAALAEWVIRRADEIYESPASALRRADAMADGHSSVAGHGLREMVTDCQNQSSWELLAIELLDLNLSSRSSDLRAHVRMIAERLFG